MLRIIIDTHGNDHDDIFLKIDIDPVQIIIADSYYLFSFLEISDEEIENYKEKNNETLSLSIRELVNHWKNILNEKGQQMFLPFDLWDEYIGGLLLAKTEFGFTIKTTHTQDIKGYEVNKSNLNNLIKQRNAHFEEGNVEWLITNEQLIIGLDLTVK